MITLYTRPSCPSCARVKEELSRERIGFLEGVLERDVTVEEVRSSFPGINVLPILAVGPHVLGGVEELKALIEGDGLKFLKQV